MGAYFDGLEKASFGGVVFPIEDVTISSTQRHHIHEYPHTPGGALEKLGRRPYTIRVTPVFDEGIENYGNEVTPLYPNRLNALQQFYENEVSSSLVIPTLGSIQAFMTSFSRRASHTNRSGERVEMEFVEDQSSRFLVSELVNSNTAADVAAKSAELIELAEQAGIKSDLFDQINEIANFVLGIADTAELYSNYAAGKIQGLALIVQKADATIEAFQNPENWRVLEALKDLASSVRGLYDNFTAGDLAPRVYTTPRQMTIQEVSLAIYGRTDRSFDLLQLNPIEDSLAIPIGRAIRYLTIE